MIPTCSVHDYHSPRPQLLDLHHVIPVSWGGAVGLSNETHICPTGHRNVHALLDAWVAAKGEPSWEIRRSYGLRERDLAAAGYSEAISLGLVPRPTL